MSGRISPQADRGDPFLQGPPATLRTLVEVVGWRARTHPARPAFTFLRDGERDEQTLSFADLDRRAAQVAERIRRAGAAGQPILLVFEPGVDYVAGLFGCMYAGAIAVPVYPPDPFRLHRTLPRLQAIVENAGANWLLTDEEMARRTRLDQISGARLLLLDGPSEGAEMRAATGPNDLALLQYTSGSTGTPRGVAISHGNLMHNFRAMHQMFDVPEAVTMNWLPPYHDMGLIGCLMLPICSGRHAVAMSPLAFMQKPARWLRAMDRFRATTCGAPNFGYELCVRKIKPSECEGLDLGSLRVVVTGAEPVRAATLEAFAERFAPHGFRREAFLPAYGMAETTLIISGKQLDEAPRVADYDLQQLESNRAAGARGDRPKRTLVSCGPPAPEVEVRIVDPHTRQPLADGRVGEIWVASPGVGRGYWRDDEQTEKMFQAALADQPSPAYLRTGDLGFVDDGELFITGRRKEMIILGGRNLYPLDIEQAVQHSHSDLKIDGGAAFAVEIDDQEQLVVVQEILRPKKNDLDAVLTGARQAVMDEAGVLPHALVLIPAGSLPKTSSGKTRRSECRRQFLEGGLRVLRRWPLQEQPQKAAATPPVTVTERMLAPVWEEVLGVEGVGLEDDFFALGGQSLRVAAMLGRVAELLDIDVPLGTLFDQPTLHGFAAAVDRLVAEQSAAPGEQSERLRLVDAPSAEPLPLTDSQQRFWFLERFAGPGGANLHIPLRLSLRGPLDRARLRDRLQDLAARHDMLRAEFGQRDGQPWQRITARCEIPCMTLDLRGKDAADAAAEHDAWRRQLEQQPFDLQQAPLVRAGLVHAGEDQWELTLVLHHLVADGWSAGLLLQELGDGQLAPPRAPGYGAYAAWQQRQTPGDEKRDYWRRRLGDAPRTLDLLAPPRGQRRGDSLQCDLEPSLIDGIGALARRFSATPYMIHLAAFQAVLSRYTGMTDLCVGTATANRHRPVLEQIVGCFINTLVLRGDLSGEPTFAGLIERTRSSVVADLEHADYPFEQLVEDLRPPRESGRLPLVQAMFVFQDAPQLPERVAGARVVDAQSGQAGLDEFDLAMVVEPKTSGATAKLCFRHDRLGGEVAQRMLESYAEVLSAVVGDPQQRLGELPVPARLERLQLLVDNNATDRRLETSCPLQMLEQAAGRHASSPAVCFEDRSLTYRQLHQQANRIARALQARGVGPDVPVGLLMRRSPEMLAAMLAVLKAGGAYLPLDPAHPDSRLAAICRDCGPPLVISHDASLAGRLPDGVEAADWSRLVEAAAESSPLAPPSRASQDHLAYVIYTSGTTGEPKGVMVTRRGVANFLASFARTPGMSDSDRVLAHTTISFDISVLELLLPLTVGAEIVLAPCGAGREPRGLIELIEGRQVTFVQATPSGFRMLQSAGWRPASGLRLLCGGEALTAELARWLTASSGDAWNVYGPTETTIWSTIERLDPAAEGAVSIGRPVDNTQVYVLDAKGRPQPTGVSGELCIGGAGVARGYWRRQRMTEEKFVPDEFHKEPGRALYRTGDQARWRTDGKLEFLGRGDAQVKVRGFRVELGEIESALNGHPEIRESAVICRSDDDGDTSLAAFLVAADEQAASPELLREHLARQLPQYMIPSEFVSLPELPRSPAGKLDRRRLQQQCAPPLRPAREFVAPRTPLEQAVADSWQQILQRDNVGLRDDFFELGGHSLKATRMLARLEAQYGVRLDIAAFFQRPTVEATAHSILLELAASAGDDLDHLLSDVEGMTDEEARRQAE